MRMINCRIRIYVTPKSPEGDFRNLQEFTMFGTLAPFRGVGVKMRQYIIPST